MSKDKLIIFDTTLRDGEQSPGASMTRDEKIPSFSVVNCSSKDFTPQQQYLSTLRFMSHPGSYM